MGNNKEYLKVMFGENSGADRGFKYKIGEVNIATHWNPKAYNPKDMGGFNFSVEDKIIRWLVRGDTIYKVTIPDDAEVIDCPSESAPHGVFRTNKIILSDPQKVTDSMALELYKKSNLPTKSYFKAMAGCAVRGHINTAIKIFNDKVNKNNVDLALNEFIDFCTDKETKKFNEEYLDANTHQLYQMLLNLKNK